MDLYSDDLIRIEYAKKLLTKGHFQIKFNKEVALFSDLSTKDREHAYYAASFAATTLFENLSPTGTNIVVHENPLHIDVVAQFEKQSHNFLWEPIPVSEGDMNSIQEKIKDKCDYIGVEKVDKGPIDMDKVEVIEEKPKKSQLDEDTNTKPSVAEKEDEPKDPVDEKVRVIEKNYLLDQLNRGA